MLPIGRTSASEFTSLFLLRLQSWSSEPNEEEVLMVESLIKLGAQLRASRTGRTLASRSPPFSPHFFALASLLPDQEVVLIDRMIDQAKTTALDMTNNVELRARNAGVPVDQYKKQAGEIASDLQKRVQEATGYVQKQGEYLFFY
jgi:hypothetical protein